MSRSDPPSPPRRLESLTSLRFFAALHVTLFHLLSRGGWELPRPLAAAIDAGPVSVSFFFVLSGFILTQAYATRPPHLAPGAYAKSRIARIYPLYAFGLVLMAPGWFASGVPLGPSLATSVLLQAWWPPWANAWNPPAWSLSAEAFFYLLFPLLLPWTLRASKRTLWLVAAAGWALMLAFAFGYHALAPDGLATLTSESVGFWLDAMKFHPLVRLPEFLVGLALGRTARDGVLLPRGVGLAALGALAVGLALSHRLPFVVLHNGLFTPLFALIIFAAATAPASGIRSLLEHRALVTLGEASYALYILQSPLLGYLHGGLRRVLPEESSHRVVLATAGLALTILASVLAWRFVERPARTWLLKRWA